MSGIKQPVTQVRLTNVAVVRLKLQGHRYEIACYKNKVLNWRQHLETDIDEVLQSRHIFTNVSKGVLASHEDLIADFHTNDEAIIAKVILEKGEIQVSEKERALALEAKHRDIAMLISEMCVNPATCRPYPVRMIETGMHSCHYSILMQKSAKSQCSAVIKLLQTVMPIERALMRCAISVEQQYGKAVKKSINTYIHSVEEETWSSTTYRLVVLLSPGAYKQIEEVLQQQQKGKGRATIEIVDMKVLTASAGDKKKEEEDEVDDEDEGDHHDGASEEAKTHAKTETSVEKQSISNKTKASVENVSLALKQSHISHPSTSSAVSTAAAAPQSQHKSKKALRKVLDNEEIRTVGERRVDDMVEEEGAIEDASVIRQQQQQAARKAKKERKQKNQHKHEEQQEEEEEAEEQRSKSKKHQDGHTEEQQTKVTTALTGSAVNNEDDDDDDEAFGKSKHNKKKGGKGKKKQIDRSSHSEAASSSQASKQNNKSRVPVAINDDEDDSD